MEEEGKLSRLRYKRIGATKQSAKEEAKEGEQVRGEKSEKCWIMYDRLDIRDEGGWGWELGIWKSLLLPPLEKGKIKGGFV
jgi:hypothetical protein